MTVPRAMTEWDIHSLSKLSMHDVSPGDGGLYHPHTKYGPWLEYTFTHDALRLLQLHPRYLRLVLGSDEA